MECSLKPTKFTSKNWLFLYLQLFSGLCAYNGMLKLSWKLFDMC